MRALCVCVCVCAVLHSSAVLGDIRGYSYVVFRVTGLLWTRDHVIQRHVVDDALKLVAYFNNCLHCHPLFCHHCSLRCSTAHQT